MPPRNAYPGNIFILVGLHKTVRINVDLDTNATAGADLAQPAPEHRLNMDLLRRLEQQPAAMAPAQHGERRRGRPQDFDTVAPGRRARQGPSRRLDRRLVAARDDQRGEAAERRRLADRLAELLA